MKLSEIPPGIYKVQKLDNVSPNAPKRPRSSPNKVQLLRVTGSRDYFLDHDLFGEHPDQLNDQYEIIEKYDPEPQIGNGLMIMKFKDAAGEEFEFKIKDIKHMKYIFEQMPWLKKPFGYVRRKN